MPSVWKREVGHDALACIGIIAADTHERHAVQIACVGHVLGASGIEGRAWMNAARGCGRWGIRYKRNARRS